MRILVVEDEPRIAADIRSGLERANYAVDSAADGEDAWFKGETEEYDAIVLDLGLPRLDGLSVLKRLRRAGIVTPVLILTALDGWRAKVEGIDAGADDYLTKPFQMEELIARVRAITRRAAGQASAVLKAGPLEIDTRARTASIDGRDSACRRWSTACSPIWSCIAAAPCRRANCSSTSTRARAIATSTPSRRSSHACARSSACR